MKHYLLMATAILAMASCANDTDLSGGNPSALGDGSISFNMNTPAATRADGTAEDANKLGGMFIVWGEKNETDGTAATPANTVFQNYVVKYTDGTANTTTSNTKNWEYVGIDHADFDTNVKNTVGSGTAQTIKYWDDQANSYTFTAISALQDDIKQGNVVITKNTSSTATGEDGQTTTGSVYDKGYTVEVKKDAKVDNIFYADRKPITKGDKGYTHETVQMTFRNFMSKVRFGIYETVPGYKVVITGIKYDSLSTAVIHPKGTTTGSDDDAVTTYDNAFGIDGNFIVTGENTKFKVTYEDHDSDHENKAKVELDGDPNADTFLNTGGATWLTTTGGIGTAANNPTWDNVTENTVNYTTILPNPSNKTNMKLQISYKLVSEDTGEEIVFKDTENKEIFRTVEVPAEYCQWKSNYTYSYIFKITDKSADLYPITFDAVVESEQTGNAETITTVTDPSITTIASRTADGKTTIVNRENEYKSGDVIYATVMDGSSLATLSVGESGNIKLYTVTTTDATNYPITEASVAHALNQAEGTGTKVKATDATGTLTNTVPTEDGSTIDLSSTQGETKAFKWTAADNTVYAVQYKKADNTYTYKIVRINGATGGSTDGQSDAGDIENVSVTGFDKIN